MMNSPAEMNTRVEDLGKSSRRAALLTILGLFLVLGAIGYAMVQLSRLQNEVEDLRLERQDLIEQINHDRAALDSLRDALRDARLAVTATRAAINAFHAGSLEDAVSLYDEALQADPQNAYVQNLRAYALFRLGRLDEAIRGQRQSLATDSLYAWGYLDLARFLCAANPPRMEEARQAARTAITLRPGVEEIMRRDGEFQRVCGGRIP